MSYSCVFAAGSSGGCGEQTPSAPLPPMLPLLCRHCQPLFWVSSSVVVSLRRRPSSFDPSSSLPSPWGIPGHSDRPRRSRPDPSLPLSSSDFPTLPLARLLRQDPRLRCPARGVSSVFVSGDAYANPAAVLFLLLKIVVLSVADGLRSGRRTAAFQPG